jgi:hypothetical protein
MSSRSSPGAARAKTDLSGVERRAGDTEPRKLRLALGNFLLRAGETFDVAGMRLRGNFAPRGKNALPALDRQLKRLT